MGCYPQDAFESNSILPPMGHLDPCARVGVGVWVCARVGVGLWVCVAVVCSVWVCECVWCVVCVVV